MAAAGWKKFSREEDAELRKLYPQYKTGEITLAEISGRLPTPGGRTRPPEAIKRRAYRIGITQKYNTRL